MIKFPKILWFELNFARVMEGLTVRPYAEIYCEKVSLLTYNTTSKYIYLVLKERVMIMKPAV